MIFFFFLNITKSQTILLVSTILKLFGYLITRDQMTYFPTMQQLRWILGPLRHWTWVLRTRFSVASFCFKNWRQTFLFFQAPKTHEKNQIQNLKQIPDQIESSPLARSSLDSNMFFSSTGVAARNHTHIKSDPIFHA